MPIDAQERKRRHALLQAHYAAENDHDIERIMNTFSKDGVMLYNRQSFPSDETIRWAHGYIGMTGARRVRRPVQRDRRRALHRRRDRGRRAAHRETLE
jgi:hypothetical protein